MTASQTDVPSDRQQKRCECCYIQGRVLLYDPEDHSKLFLTSGQPYRAHQSDRISYSIENNPVVIIIIIKITVV